MQRDLDDLDSGVIAGLQAGVHRQRHVRQTEAARVRISAGAGHLEDGQHDVGHADGLRSVAHVDVEEGGRMAGVPAGHDGDRAAAQRPVGAVSRGCNSGAWFPFGSQ